jgi:hypothetical protein
MAAATHESRHQLDAGELSVVADGGTGIERLIAAEKSVAKEFARSCGWPHKRVNLFVYGTLQPLAEQIQRTARALGGTQHAADAAAQDLDRKPMVHTYNLADLSECNVFVNRALMINMGLWERPRALEGMLAHEHAHPLAENGTTRAARDVSVTIRQAEAGGTPQTGASLGANCLDHVVYSLERLAQVLCLQAPHEVFTNEMVIGAGFPAALMELNRANLTEGRAGPAARDGLRRRLELEVENARLTEADVELFLFLAAVESHAPFALETAAFTRAGRTEDAQELETLLWRQALDHEEPEVGEIYNALYARYAGLQPDMSAQAFRGWAAETFAPVTAALASRGAAFTASFRAAGDESGN